MNFGGWGGGQGAGRGEELQPGASEVGHWTPEPVAKEGLCGR